LSQSLTTFARVAERLQMRLLADPKSVTWPMRQQARRAILVESLATKPSSEETSRGRPKNFPQTRGPGRALCVDCGVWPLFHPDPPAGGDPHQFANQYPPAGTRSTDEPAGQHALAGRDSPPCRRAIDGRPSSDWRPSRLDHVHQRQPRERPGL
jgi:hypothetical protein